VKLRSSATATNAASAPSCSRFIVEFRSQDHSRLGWGAAAWRCRPPGSAAWDREKLVIATKFGFKFKPDGSKIPIQGARYPEQVERMTGR